jgi:hypothetical protein
MEHLDKDADKKIGLCIDLKKTNIYNIKGFWEKVIIIAVKHLDKDADGIIHIILDLETKKVTIK